MKRRAGLVLAIAVIVLALPPWRSGFQDHPHWHNVGWVPFVSPPVVLRDIIRNGLLFMPLGAAVAANVRRRPMLVSAAVAFVLSVAGEATQLYSHSRFPSATDVVMNVLGALGGAWLIRLHTPGMRSSVARPDVHSSPRPF